MLGCVHPSLVATTMTAGQPPLTELPAKFELLSWNTHKQRGRRFEAELRRFCAGIELVLLQEAVELEPAWDLLAQPRAWSLVVAFEYGADEVATGVATASEATPVDEQPLLSPIREPLTRTPKSALLTWIAIAERDEVLLVANLHGINFRPVGALEAQLATLEPFLAAHLGPLVVAGDFNTWSGNRRAAVEDFAARHGLISPFPEQRFDNVYVRGVEILAAEVLASRSSDHDALRVELRVL